MGKTRTEVLSLSLGLLLVWVGRYSVSASSKRGFSLDCGGSGGWDPVTTLNWTKDNDYLESEEQLVSEDVTRSVNTIIHPTTDTNANAKYLSSARIFYPALCPYYNKYSRYDPDQDLNIARDGDFTWFDVYRRFDDGSMSTKTGRLKFCYKLPLDREADESVPPNVLIRATFPAQSWFQTELKECSGPLLEFDSDTISFSFYVEGGRPVLVQLNAFQPKVLEFVVSPPSSSHLHVCLAPIEKSVAVISALEIRPLAHRMEYADEDHFVMTLSRWDFGGDLHTSPIRYPIDKYDRLWVVPTQTDFFNDLEQINVITTSENTTERGVSFEHEGYEVPEEVMKTAWKGANATIVITLKVNAADLTATPHSQTISYSGLKIHAYFYDVRSTRSSQASSSMHVEISSGEFPHHSFSFLPGVAVKSVESFGDVSNVNISIYSNKRSIVSPFINAIELFLQLEVTKVSLASEASALRNLVEVMNLSSRLDTVGDPCVPVTYPWITCSKESNSPPRITGITLPSIEATKHCVLPENLWMTFDGLTYLEVPGDGCFNRNLPASFASLSNLLILRIFGNTHRGVFPTTNLPWQTLRSLDLRGNELGGSLPLEIERMIELQSLYLSHNNFKGKLRVRFHLLQKLRVLNLEKNHLEGTVPDYLWTSPSLEKVDLSSNRFTKLNLTSWLKAVEEAKRFKYKLRKMDVFLYYNDIDEVFPNSLEHLDFDTTSLGYISLHGNPWCIVRNQSGLSSPAFRFLCSDNEYGDSRKNTLSGVTLIILLVISCVLVAFLLGTACYFGRKFRQRSFELRRIQEALAKEHVKPPFFNYNDLRDATAGFSSACVLGKGGFGTVFKAILPDGDVLAVKKLKPTEQNTSEFLKEIVNVLGIKHKHLVQLKGCCVRDKDHRMLVYEYAENRSLAEALWSPARAFTLTWSQRLAICLGVARGLAYLHEELQPMMVHRDIKPQNILLDKEYSAKIADFGLARPAPSKDTQVTANIGGTRGYLPPEYLIEGLVSEKLDVYSFGVVLLETVSGRACIEVAQSGDRIYLPNVASSLDKAGQLVDLVDEELAGTYSEEEAMLVLEIGLSCCQLNPKQRPSMSHVVSMLSKQSPVSTSVQDLTGPRFGVETIAEESEEDLNDFNEISVSSSTAP